MKITWRKKTERNDPKRFRKLFFEHWIVKELCTKIVFKVQSLLDNRFVREQNWFRSEKFNPYKNNKSSNIEEWITMVRHSLPRYKVQYIPYGVFCYIYWFSNLKLFLSHSFDRISIFVEIIFIRNASLIKCLSKSVKIESWTFYRNALV